LKFKRMLTTIDTHTGGQPTRTVTSGIPHIPGKTVADKMIYLRDNEDWIRKVLVNEPRGSSIMSGVILTEPCTPQAHIGFIFIEVGGYLPMCGHDTIGACTALIESGFIKPVEPFTTIAIDTPAGLVNVKVKVEKGSVREVSFVNVPSFVFADNIVTYVPVFGDIKVNVSYGGNYYAIVEAEQFGFKIKPGEASDIVKAAQLVLEIINEKIKVFHPEKPFVNRITHVQFCTRPTHPEAHGKNVVVFHPGGIDRSPCGTGTSAKMAALYLNGELKKGDVFVHESIIGTLYKCRLLEETRVGGFRAIIPEITGSAYVTGMHTFVMDPNDPIQEGFQLG